MEKKNIISLVLLIALIISGITNIVLMNIDFSPQPKEEPPDFVIGTASGPNTIELVDSWDSASNDILHQVVETLFSYDLYDLDLPRINKLAHSYWWDNSTKLHIRLKEGVLFHDGTPFNAVAAKWNLDRLQYLINATGTNTGEIAHTQSLWMFPDRETFIIDSITTQGDYNLTIALNGPYGPFLNTLAYINAGMISPTAHSDDETNFIDLATGDIVGTGPFKYDFFTPNKEVILTRWEGYWKNLANFERIKFAIIPDSADRNNAMLDKSVDFLIGIDPSFFPSFENDSSITLKRFTDDSDIPSLSYTYLAFNNMEFNTTWRRLFSYAINYSFVIEEMKLGHVVRANSPISPAFGKAYNASTTALNFNTTKAREIMVSMGFGNMSWTDAQWIAVADGDSPFLEIHLDHCNWGGYFRGEFLMKFHETFKLIGIRLNDSYWAWDTCPYFPEDDYNFILLLWSPDYLDPFNMLNPLFNPNSSSNAGQIDDMWLNEKLNRALNTTDDDARYEIYKSIQSYMTEVGFFHAYLYHPKIFFVHSADLYGVPYNAMERFEAYGIRRA